MFCARCPNYGCRCHEELCRTSVCSSKDSKVLLTPLGHEQSLTRHSHLDLFGVWRILCRIPVTCSTFKVQRETYESSSVRWQTLLGVQEHGRCSPRRTTGETNWKLSPHTPQDEGHQPCKAPKDSESWVDWQSSVENKVPIKEIVSQMPSGRIAVVQQQQ